MNVLEKELKVQNNSHIWETFMASSSLGKLSFLLGNYGYCFGDGIGDVFDRACKLFLVNAWHIRRDLVTVPPV